MRRTILLSVLILILVGCAGYYKNADTVPCPPIVSIDPATRKPTPDPIHAKRGQWVHFFFDDDVKELDIKSDVLEKIDHKSGHAWGRVKPDASYGKHPYTIIDVTSGKRSDPDIEIDK